LLSINYDAGLLAMSTEVQHWERLRMAVPYVAMEAAAQRDKLRVLRENLLLVTASYNKVPQKPGKNPPYRCTLAITNCCHCVCAAAHGICFWHCMLRRC
jgi:hypothetical protein